MPSSGAGPRLSAQGWPLRDGLDDLVVGATGNDDGGSGAGKADLILSDL